MKLTNTIRVTLTDDERADIINSAKNFREEEFINSVELLIEYAIRKALDDKKDENK